MEASCLRYLWQEAFCVSKPLRFYWNPACILLVLHKKALAFSRGIIYNISNLKSLE